MSRSPRLRPVRRSQLTRLPSRKRRQPVSHPSSPTPSRSRFLRRWRRTPASPTSSSAMARTRWISGSSIWRDPVLFSSPAREARPSLPTTRAISPVSRATTRANGRSSSNGPFARPPAPRSRPQRSCPSPSRSGTGTRASVATGEVSRLWYHVYVEPAVVPSAVGPMVKTALIILAIELAVIGWVRRRHGSRDHGKLGPPSPRSGFGEVSPERG